MGFVRVRCKRSGPPPRAAVDRIDRTPRVAYPVIHGLLPSWSDTEIVFVDDDGSERPLEHVTAIRWQAKQGTDLPTLYLEIVGAEVELEAKPAGAFEPDPPEEKSP